jgi:hypothetical protein
MGRNYWLDLFTGKTLEKFEKNDAKIYEARVYRGNCGKL